MVMSNHPDVLSEEDIRLCTSEEADPKMVRHAINFGKCGISEVVIKTVDSDAYAHILQQLGVTS